MQAVEIQLTCADHGRLKQHINSMSGGLDARIHEGGMSPPHLLSNSFPTSQLTFRLPGSNLSLGQRQLLSICRALLTPSNILILDEATAAVDVETDAFLQTRMKSVFRDRTIVTIAHRINTILDSDRIVVLDKGRVAEVGTPRKLMEERGLFWKLVKEAGLEGAVEREANKGNLGGNGKTEGK